MRSHHGIDPERAGLDPSYDYQAVERMAEARVAGRGLRRADFLRLAGVSAAALLIGCGSDDEQSGGASAQGTATPEGGVPDDVSGTINFFSYQGYDIPDLAKPWLAENEITFKAKYFQDGLDIANAVQRGGGKSPYNLSSYFAGRKQDYLKRELYTDIDRSQVPELENVYESMLDPESLGQWWLEGDRLLGVPFTFGGNTLLYDEAEVPTPPTSWKEFLDPSWKDRFVIVDDASATLAMGAKMIGNFNVDMRYTEAELEAILAELSKLKANARTVASYGALPDLLAGGDVVAATAGWAAVANQAAAKGKTTIKSALPDEGGSSFVDVWFIPPNDATDDLPAVHAFMNFTLEPSTQAGMAKALAGGAVTPDAVPELDAATKALYPYDDLDGFFEKAPNVGLPAEAEGDTLAWDDIEARFNAWKGE
jgi:spermidine/putrescine transport system substrate-binding protein